MLSNLRKDEAKREERERMWAMGQDSRWHTAPRATDSHAEQRAHRRHAYQVEEFRRARIISLAGRHPDSVPGLWR
jgi:hypothetical protein